jgi:phenylalanyl-tRNA synthetase beta chain
MVLRRFIKLVSEHTNIKDMSMISYNFKDNPNLKIPVNVHKINQIIGINISEKDYLSNLSKLAFILEEGFIKVPSFRSDVKTQNDLAEEVARVIGYDNISTSEISIQRNERANYIGIENKLRYFLIDNGFYEIINSPFTNLSSKKAIKVDNPLDSNREFLRTNITNSLIDNLLFNERRQKDSIKLFEISDVYSFNNGINKKRKLSIVASGRVGLNYEDFSKKIDKKYLNKLFYEILPSQKFDFQIISRETFSTKVKNEIIGCEVEVDEISYEVLNYKEKAKSPNTFIQYSPISDLPYSKRDLSFSVKDFSKCKLLEEYILGFQDELLKKVFVFDYFHNKKNAEIKIGFRLIFQSTETTIKEFQVSNIIDVIIEHTKKIKGINIPGLN